MYQPKINKEALLLGYTGIRPAAFGVRAGYLARLTKPNNNAKPNNDAKSNPQYKGDK